MPEHIFFTHWNLDRIVAHEIFPMSANRRRPSYGRSLLTLTPNAKAIFLDRVQDALRNEAKCMEMALADTGDQSFCSRAEALLNARDDAAYIDISKKVANLLHTASSNRAIPGGLLLVFSGTVSGFNRPFVGVLKAESQTGFTRSQTTHGPALSLLEELFLTPSARMYKMGLFVRPPRRDGTGRSAGKPFIPFIFDTSMSRRNRESSALYFYSAFLGCKFPNDAARMTRRFFDLTRQFIFDSGLVAEGDKIDYYTALQAYLRSQRPDIQTAYFAATYIDGAERQDTYKSWMQDQDFPTRAFPKDSRDLGTSLQNRRLKFGSSIKLSGPADAMDELVEVTSIESPENADGESGPWTRIIIRKPLDGAD